jgi:hypothetical protein
MKHVTFIQILKPAWNVVGKMQMGEEGGSPKVGDWCNVRYQMKEGNTPFI